MTIRGYSYLVNVYFSICSDGSLTELKVPDQPSTGKAGGKKGKRKQFNDDEM